MAKAFKIVKGGEYKQTILWSPGTYIFHALVKGGRTYTFKVGKEKFVNEIEEGEWNSVVKIFKLTQAAHEFNLGLEKNTLVVVPMAEHGTNKSSFAVSPLDLQEDIDVLESKFEMTKKSLTITFEQTKKELDGKISNNNSVITQLAHNIRMEVSSAVQDLDGKISENTSSISQTAEEIRHEVNEKEKGLKSEFVQTAKLNKQELTDEIEGLRSLIMQTADGVTILSDDVVREINARISVLSKRITSEVTDLSDGVKKTGVDIESGKITLYADKTIFKSGESKDETLEEYIENAISDIEIGSRNLILNSKLDLSGVKTNQVAELMTTADLVNGNEYTIVLRGFVNERRKLTLWMNEHANKVGEFSIYKNGVKTKFITFTAAQPLAAQNRRMLRVYNSQNENHKDNLTEEGLLKTPDEGFKDYPATLGWVALYSGAIKPPLDWSPAPENADYLKKAFVQDTTIKGGVVTTGVVAAKDSDGKVRSYQSGTGEIAFAGGVKNFGTNQETRTFELTHDGWIKASKGQIGGYKIENESLIFVKKFTQSERYTSPITGDGVSNIDSTTVHIDGKSGYLTFKPKVHGIPDNESIIVSASPLGVFSGVGLEPATSRATGDRVSSCIVGYLTVFDANQNVVNAGVFGGINKNKDPQSLGRLYGGWFDKVRVNGLHTNTKRVSYNTTLTEFDDCVFCFNTSEINITLPSNPQTGKTYKIKRCASGNVIFKAKKSFFLRKASTFLGLFSQDAEVTLIYDGEYWQASKIFTSGHENN